MNALLKRWLRGLLSHVQTWLNLVSNQRFIVVYLWFIFNCYARHPAHTKISDEYVIKNVDWGVYLVMCKPGAI